MILPAAAVSFSYSFYQTPGQALGVASGDFNRDGLPDLAVLHFDSQSAPAVGIRRGIGGGKFGALRNFSIRPNATDIKTADMNGDGRLDLVIAHSSTSVLTVLLGNGDGTFRPGADLVLAAPAFAIALGDFNRDGAVDIAALECSSSCNIAMFMNNRNGTFHTSRVVFTGGNGKSLVATDFNRDSNLDVVTAVGPPSQMQVYLGDGNGSFTSEVAAVVDNPFDPNSAAESVPSAAAADFNGDGVPDVAILAGTVCGSACGADNVHIFLSNGAGNFLFKTKFQIWGSGGGGRLVASDLSGDRAPELIYSNPTHFGGGAKYVLGRGDGTFGSSTGLPLSEVTGLIARDFSLDSRHDIADAEWLAAGLVVGINTSATTNCAPPRSSQLAARICGPAANASIARGSSFSVRASGNSPAGVKRLELWVDGVKRYEIWNDQLKRTLAFSTTGTHRITVVAVDEYVGIAKASVSVSVH